MVRRLKADLIHSGEPFPRRVVEPIELKGLPANTPELVLASKLAAYGELREKRLNTLPAREKAHAKIVFIGNEVCVITRAASDQFKTL